MSNAFIDWGGDPYSLEVSMHLLSGYRFTRMTPVSNPTRADSIKVIFGADAFVQSIQ